MAKEFDKAYWESHWRHADGHTSSLAVDPIHYLAPETSALVPGTALDAGCGEGAGAIWLAQKGWDVTAADISSEALAHAIERATIEGTAPGGVTWVEADLGVFEPGRRFDLVTTHYAHPDMPQLTFYERIADWVAPGGTLLIVGHLQTAETSGHGSSHHHEGRSHRSPDAASVTAASITAVLEATRWDIITAAQPSRAIADDPGRTVELDDVVVRATRRRRPSSGGLSSHCQP